MTERLNMPNPEEEPRQQQLSDIERVNEAVELARTTNGIIPHEVARVIAARLAQEEDVALFNLAASGEVHLQGLMQELGPLLMDDQTPPEVVSWIEAMKVYLRERDDFGPQDGWEDLWVSDGYTEMNACTICGSHRTEPHNQTCPRGDFERADQEPGAGGDLMRILNRSTTTLYDMGERHRIRADIEAYIEANYVSIDQVAADIVVARTDELRAMNGIIAELAKDPDAVREHLSMGRMMTHVSERVTSISKVAQRKPE